MDWIRRNWPDLLIGIALVAVIAGIIITLLSGGSFSMFDRSRRTVTTPNQTTTNNSPFTQPEQTTPSAQAGIQDGGIATPPTNTNQNTTGTANTANTTTANTTTNTTANTTTNTTAGIEPILPDLPVTNDQNNSQNSQVNTLATPAAEVTTDIEPGTISESQANLEANLAANAAAANIPAAAPAGAPYRVSVGAFARRQNAEEFAVRFRERGYPVFVAQEDSLFITLIGPYQQESAANQVANRIRAEGDDALVYRLSEPDASTTQPAATTAATTTAAPAATSTTAPTTASREPVSSLPVEQTAAAVDAAIDTVEEATPSPSPDWTNRGGTYLQVGAYASLESSLPQRRRLESLGFNVSERFGDNLVRLVIGPFTEAEVPVARAQLSANGIDNFPVQ